MTEPGVYTGTSLIPTIREQGRSVRWVAEQMGVARQSIYDVQAGTWTPTAAFRASAARVLGVPEAALFFFAPDVTPVTDPDADDTPGEAIA